MPSPAKRFHKSSSTWPLRVGAVVLTSFSVVSAAMAREPSGVSTQPIELAQLSTAPTPDAVSQIPLPGAPQSQFNGSAKDSKWQVSLGLGMDFRPEYPGSGKIKANPLPYASVVYDRRVFASTTQGIGVYFWNAPHFQVGASFGLDDVTRYRGENAILRGLPKIGTGGSAMLFAHYEIGPLAFDADVKQRIGSVNGVSADLGAAYRVRVKRWSFSFGPSITFASASLNDGFFGVTPSDAVTASRFGNPLPAYHPGAGIRDVSYNISARYQMNAHWGVQTFANLAVLVGRDGNSPLTRQRFQPQIGSFVYYDF